MKKSVSFLFLFSAMRAASVLAYTNIVPADLHARLVKGDTLLLLDVREVSEYRNGHIAEPAGLLPMTPASLPWNSGILAAEYSRLPAAADIVVYCGSGGRSAASSAFLESKGFTRVFNMTGGFSSWAYERRVGGFGDHSGAWIRSDDPGPTGVMSQSADFAGAILFPGGMPLEADSMYVELHAAAEGQGIPSGAPESELSAVYRVTCLDRFGLSLFVSDSLALPAAASFSLGLRDAAGQPGSAAADPGWACYAPAKGWISVPFNVDGYTLFREDSVLLMWNALSGSASTAVEDRAPLNSAAVGVYPNPFNGRVRILAPAGASITVFDVRGRLIDRPESNVWMPERTANSGFYFIRIDTGRKSVIKRVLYLK
jgi:rhodanese-related sulfurtransferase